MPLHWKAVAWFGSMAPIPKLTLHVNGLLIWEWSSETSLQNENFLKIIPDPGFGCFGAQEGTVSA